MNAKTTLTQIFGLAIALTLANCTTNQPTPPPTNPETERALVSALATHLGDNGIVLDASLPYKSQLIDLNNDNIQDALVLLVSPNWCGSGGCTLLVFQGQTDNQFQFVSQSTLIQDPLLVSDTTTNNWHDLIVSVRGGGAKPAAVALKFDGNAYPLNPSTEDPLPPQTVPQGIEIFSETTQARPFGDTAEREALCRQAIAEKFDLAETELQLTFARADEGLAIYDWQTADQGGYCQVKLDGSLGEVEVTR
jgi:hypothetical protein